tara:strand:- start:35 stop:238 length:204 start_codon:yes stop_codon:yes gene_type:complete
MNRVVLDYKELAKIFAHIIVVTLIFFVASKIADDRVEEVLTDVYREMFVVDSLIMDIKLTLDSLEVK